MDYKTKGVCSQQIHFEIEDNKITTFLLLVDVMETFREFPIWLKEWM